MSRLSRNPVNQDPNLPIDNSFSSNLNQHRASHTNSNIKFDSSIYKNLNVIELAELSQVVQEYPDALTYFPPQSELILYASCDSDGDRSLWCILKCKSEQGDTTHSTGSNHIFYRGGDFARDLEDFLQRIGRSSSRRRD